MKSRDPIRFEVLQSRLQSILDEAAISMIRVSGSPVAVYIGDLNAGIMSAEGDPILVGQYVTAKATCLSCVVKDILANYSDDPGIEPGDAFLCNDPYVGIMHQNDVAVVMPIFRDGKIMAWAGADIHQIDVGGPTPGQVQLGARDIYGEAPLIPPVRLMKHGKILKDIEHAYLRKSRVPGLVALDLRAKIAACNSLERNLQQLADMLGSDGLQALFSEMTGDAETLLSSKLKQIPDGEWRHRIYLEFEDNVHTLQVLLRKFGGRFSLDFEGTSPQAPATINMTLPAVRAWLLGDIVETLCWDMPWVIAGIERTYDILAPKGTLVNPTFPAGVSKSTTSIGMLLSTAVRSCLYRMLYTCDAFRDKAMAGWPGSKAQEELHGINQYGQVFGADILDGMAGGGGARTFADGVDTGGLAAAPKIAIANVEHHEIAYPMLYLWRRQFEDSGGAGFFRGGNGIDRAYMVHNAEAIPDMVMHSIGVRVPVTSGLDGGHPSATNQFHIARGAVSPDNLVAGCLPCPAHSEDLTWESFGALARTSLNAGDLFRSVSNCGGGLGDPLERPPEAVAEDVRLGHVTELTAQLVYGVWLVNGGIDHDATTAERARQRAERLHHAQAPFETSPSVALAKLSFRRTRYLVAGVGEDGRNYLFLDGAQPRCLCPLGVDYKRYLARKDTPFADAGPQIDPNNLAAGEYFLTRLFNPFDGTQIETEIRYRGHPCLPQVVTAA